MGRYYKVAMGFITLGFQMNLLLMASAIMVRNFRPDVEAMFICGFIIYSIAFLLAGFLNFGHMKDDRILPFAASGAAIMAAVLIGVGLSILTSRYPSGSTTRIELTFPTTVYSVSIVMAALSAGLMIFSRLRHG